MAERTRDRSLSGQREAALRKRQAAEEALARLKNAEVVAAQKRVSREIREMGAVAFAEARRDPVFRGLLLAAIERDEPLSEGRIVDLALKGPLVEGLRHLAGPPAQGIEGSVPQAAARSRAIRGTSKTTGVA